VQGVWGDTRSGEGAGAGIGCGAARRGDGRYAHGAAASGEEDVGGFRPHFSRSRARRSSRACANELKDCGRVWWLRSRHGRDLRLQPVGVGYSRVDHDRTKFYRLKPVLLRPASLELLCHQAEHDRLATNGKSESQTREMRVSLCFGFATPQKKQKRLADDGFAHHGGICYLLGWKAKRSLWETWR
jgi:hypothetical protein